MDHQTENKKKKNKLKLAFIISTSSFLFIVSVALILVFVILTDKTTSTHQKSENEITEIIKKNYINGFKNTGNSGIFSYSMSEDDINDLFEKANENNTNKYISKKYYQSIDNHHYFYIDLKNTFLVKTRVVFDTVVTSINDDFSYNLGIVSCKMGKTNALTLLKKASLLTEDVFYSDYLPIKYNDEKNEFTVSPLTFIDSFPKSDISELFFGIAKDNLSIFSLNGSLFGFNVDFSKHGNSAAAETDLITEYDLYNELKTGCESVDFSSLSVGDSRTSYSINEEVLSTLLSRSCSHINEEKIDSQLTTETVIFDLISARALMKPDNRIQVSLCYSLNAYHIDFVNELELIDASTIYFSSSIETKNLIKIGTKIYEGKENKFVSKVISDMNKILAQLSTIQSEFFTFTEERNTLDINLKTMNDNFSDLDLKYSQKSIKVNPLNKRLDFVVTKAS